MNTPKTTPVNERFGQYFRVSPALDDAARDEVYFIRHDVYARELGFEPVRPDAREMDVYDRHSLHCVVRTNDDNVRPVGCARVVLVDPRNPQAPLPFEIACKDSLDRSIIDPASLPRDRIAEVSRLAVMGEFRRRKGEDRRPVALSTADSAAAQPGNPMSRFPNIPVSLYFGAVAMAQRQGIEYLFTLTEPRLAKHFARGGVNIQAIGAPIEHRGLRVPSLMRVSELYSSLRAMVRPIWHEVHAQIDTAYLVHHAIEQSLQERETVSVSVPLGPVVDA
ncbi:PEP-CTERM/exosortase system-associated acyltransferase [Pseudorhodoferax sp. Leaf267]|uniref:PEP-CTERM/exosortase system-associated acyltransferase n=1 Tax=Pseudorhodoferax sp. Leaf267 TaxID=1736316 RepID=UPI0009E6A26A|nr:PEP-CTERM/exosortase system-associated acyltransferase [Pseudorhodoferax sp. Leaf267]